MGAYDMMCCFKWLKFTKKINRSQGVRHDPSKHGHFRGGASPAITKRRKVSRMRGTLSVEDVGDENTQRSILCSSPMGSDLSGSSGRTSPAGANNLVVPRTRGLGLRILTPSIAASTPDLRKAQDHELDNKKSNSNKNLDATWLSSQSITNLSAGNNSLNVSHAQSNASSWTKSKDNFEGSEESCRNLKSKVAHGEDRTGVSSERKMNFLGIPMLGKQKKKLASSTPDLSQALKDNGGRIIACQSSFNLDQEANSEVGAIMAREHGLNFDLYKNEVESSIKSPTGDSHRVYDKHVDDTYGTVHFTVALRSSGMLSVSLKKLMDLPYKGVKPMQFSVVAKVHILPENKKFPARLAGVNGVKHSPNPIFEEDYHWNNIGSLDDKSLCISVYEKGRQGQYDAIGHSLLHLGSAKLQEQPKTFSISLKNTSQPSKNEGSIQLSLAFKTGGGKEVEIHAFQAKGLHIGDLKRKESVSTFVKASFYIKGKKEKSKRSPVEKEEDPMYNHSFSFPVPPEAQLNDSQIVVSVIQKGGRLSHQVIGKVKFGPHYFINGNQTDWGCAIVKGQKITRWYGLSMID